MLKADKLSAPGLDLPAVKRFGGEESLGIADCHPGLDRFRSERRKKRREHASIFERAEGGDVKLRYATEQREDPIPLGHAALGKDVGKPIHCRAERGVAELSDSVVAPNPAQGEPVAATGSHVSVDRLVRDVEPPARQSVEQRPHLHPRERPGVLVVVQEIGADTVVRSLVDSLPFHIRPWANSGYRRCSFLEYRCFAVIRLNSLDQWSVFRGDFSFDLDGFLLEKLRWFIDTLIIGVVFLPFLRNDLSLDVVPYRFHGVPRPRTRADRHLQSATLR